MGFLFFTTSIYRHDVHMHLRGYLRLLNGLLRLISLCAFFVEIDRGPLSLLTISPSVQRRFVGVYIDCHVSCHSRISLACCNSRVVHIETFTPKPSPYMHLVG